MKQISKQAVLCLLGLLGTAPILACADSFDTGMRADPRSEQADQAHVFEGDIPIKTSYDMNRNGNVDEVYYYRKHSVAKIEWDRDKDGTFDFRAIYDEPADGQRNIRYQLTKINGAYRLVPSITAAQWPEHGNIIYADPPPRYEVLIDGSWTGDFKTEVKRTEIAPACGQVTRVSTFTCLNGKPVRLETPAIKEQSMNFALTLYENGRPKKHVSGLSPDQISSEVEFPRKADILSVSRYDRDNDGEFDEEVTQRQTPAGYNVSLRQRTPDGWIDTFIRQGMRYVNGLHTETIDPETGKTYVRYEYDDQGKFLWTYTDHDKDGNMEMRYAPDGRAQSLRNGAWTSDFAEHHEQPGVKIQTTYHDGLQVRQEVQRGGVLTFTVSPKPNQVFEGLGERLHTWRYYSTEKELPWGYRLLREARDLDADGEPDLFVDYETLMITKNRPALWPE